LAQAHASAHQRVPGSPPLPHQPQAMAPSRCAATLVGLLVGVSLSPVARATGAFRGSGDVAALPIAATAGAQDAAPAPRRLALPPWWILNGVQPQGPEKDMGHWRAVTFSKEQQAKFGVNDMGEVVDKKQFHRAMAALKAGEPNGKEEDTRQGLGAGRTMVMWE